MKTLVIIGIIIVFICGLVTGFWLRSRFIDKAQDITEQQTIVTEIKQPINNKVKINSIELIRSTDPIIQLATTITSFDFSPAVTLNADGLYDSKFYFAPALGVSFFKFRKNGQTLLMMPELQVATLNLKDYTFIVSPISFNIGYYLPIIDNTYVKPLVGWHNGKLSLGLGIGLNF